MGIEPIRVLSAMYSRRDDVEPDNKHPSVSNSLTGVRSNGVARRGAGVSTGMRDVASVQQAGAVGIVGSPLLPAARLRGRPAGRRQAPPGAARGPHAQGTAAAERRPARRDAFLA